MKLVFFCVHTLSHSLFRLLNGENLFQDLPHNLIPIGLHMIIDFGSLSSSIFSICSLHFIVVFSDISLMEYIHSSYLTLSVLLLCPLVHPFASLRNLISAAASCFLLPSLPPSAPLPPVSCR
jgi:hypothetical protein